MLDLVKSMYDLIRTNEGKFKSEKQANFLREVLNRQDGFLGWTSGHSQIFSDFDEKGFIKVYKILKDNKHEVIFERSVEGKLTSIEIKDLASYKRKLKKARLSVKERKDSWQDGTYGKGDYKSDPHTVELYISNLERLDREIGYLEERINKIEGKLIPAELF
jgi:hypothetical protein